MRNFLRYLFIFVLACFCFIIIDDVYAISNLNGLSDLTLDPFGVFYDNVNGTSRSIGYYMGLVGEDPSDPLAYYVAFPTGSTQYTNGGQGGSIVQCNMSFVQGNYYSVTYYWLSDSNSYYYHPFYSNLSNKLAIGNSISVSYPNFTYESISQSVQTKLVQNIGYVSAYTVIFKAPQTGTCLLSTFSSSPTGPSDGLGFVGYTYRSLGSTAPTSAEIALELNAQFSSIENSLNTGFGAVIGSINSSNTQIGDKVDSSTDEIINNQEQNKQEIIDNENANHQEAENTRKGILGKLGDLFNSIGEWFSNLISGITEGFTNLFNSIKSLFVGEEVCDVTDSNYFTGYDGIDPDSDGWITLEYTSSSNGEIYTSPTKSDFDTSKSYNAFIEVQDYSTTSNGSFEPFMRTAQFYQDTMSGSIELSDLTAANINWSKKDNLFNLVIKPYPPDNSHFMRSMLLNWNSGTSKITFRILITDDMSMTLDNYEYFTTREECTTKGGLFGMLSDFFSFITDDTPADSDVSVLGNVQGLLPPGPVDSLLNIPFQFLSVLTSSFGGVCVPLSGTFVFDSTLTLPCFSEMFYDNVPSYLMNFISLIPSGFLLIKYFKHLYKKVDRAVNLNTNADDEWGVL